MGMSGVTAFDCRNVQPLPICDPEEGLGLDYSTKLLFTRYPQMGKIGAESDDDEQTTI